MPVKSRLAMPRLQPRKAILVASVTITADARQPNQTTAVRRSRTTASQIADAARHGSITVAWPKREIHHQNVAAMTFAVRTRILPAYRTRIAGTIAAAWPRLA
jgi:hypothetical protein